MQTEETNKSISIKTEKRIKLITTIIMAIIIIVGLLVTTDIILVKKANIGPFFAIRTKVYDDGGTQEYYGLFYKVIKYHQEIGRRDTVIGSYNLKYDTTPTNYTVETLSYALNNSSQNYSGNFIRLTGTIAKIDLENNTISLSYQDNLKGKYDLTIKAYVISENLNKLNENAPVSLIGTISSYDFKEKELTISNVFVE
ncbi:MAG TPA: hypothetical protein IAB45_01585 [Candidatus Onthousia faecavium]|nr:hypothetical protein [Candidatus Onthousia faecavium]